MSLTKKSLLEAAISRTEKPHELGEFLGQVIHVKKMTELKRTRRAASMFDKKGELSEKYRERSRLYTIVDHVCDEAGEMVFGDKDIVDLQGIQSDLLDDMVEAIANWITGEEKNE